nr:hypothetical protein [Tanacetum cinerariifolium]
VRRYRVAALGFYQRDNENPSYQERRQTMEETLPKFMAESAKRHDSLQSLRRLLKEKSRIEKEIKATMYVHCSAILKDELPQKEKT